MDLKIKISLQIMYKINFKNKLKSKINIINHLNHLMLKN